MGRVAELGSLDRFAHVMPNTPKHNDLLNAAFDDERVLRADIPELYRYLLACTEMRDTDILNDRVREGVPKRTEFIKLRIQSLEREISHRELATRGKWTLWVAVGTFIFLALKTLYDICR